MAKYEFGSEADKRPGQEHTARMLELIDTHCHLDAAEFSGDRQQVLDRAQACGVVGIVVPAVSAAGWAALDALCSGSALLHPAFGLHPMFLADHRPEHLPELRRRLQTSRAVAVGECGLDYFVEGLDRTQQQFYFEAQLGIAREFDLPVIVHARRAVDAVIAAIRRVGGLRGVVHSFSGSAEQAELLRRIGFLLGIGGPVTHARAQRLRRLVATLPSEQLLLESDAPDQAPASRRGQRNSPEFLTEVLQTVAELRGESAELVARVSGENARRLFALAPEFSPVQHKGMVGK